MAQHSLSVFDLFKVGIGPSSSHTVGPMRATHNFVTMLEHSKLLSSVERVVITLYGSLGATGIGHASDLAVIMGLLGEQPETTDPESVKPMLAAIEQDHVLPLARHHRIRFSREDDLILNGDHCLPFHPNGMTCQAFSATGQIAEQSYYSVGGGFIVTEEQADMDRFQGSAEEIPLPYPFNSGAELLAQCREYNISVSELMLANECAIRSETEVRHKLLEIWHIMQQCVNNGCAHIGTLPGGLNVRRRAPDLYQRLCELDSDKMILPQLGAMDWVNLYAMAVNEENAAGGRVVTAPTNGAAGVVPAVLHYYHNFYPDADDDGVVSFLLTAAAVGILCKLNASISGAEVGCQGEVGSACAMAAAGLAEVGGGTPEQVENAAEIGMEHNLGLTCDPIAGLVQVPCIERNAMAAVKAINAAQLALRGDGHHLVSLDKVIRTMRDTGADMKDKYKETSKGGLAVNYTEC